MMAPSTRSTAPSDRILAGIRQGGQAQAGPEQLWLSLVEDGDPTDLNIGLRPLPSPLSGGSLTLLPFPIARAVIDAAAALGTPRLRLTGHVDPAYHPDLIAIIEHAESQGLRTSLSTTLLPLSASDLTRLQTLALDELEVVLGAATPPSFAALYPALDIAQHERLQADLNRLCAPSPRPAAHVQLACPIGGDNAAERLQRLDLAIPLGADEVRFYLPSGCAGRWRPLAPLDRLSLMRELVAGRTDLGAKGVRPAPLRELPRVVGVDELLLDLAPPAGNDRDLLDPQLSVPCAIGWLAAQVRADGAVLPCCGTGRRVMGNLHETPFAEIWQGSLYAAFRNQVWSMPRTEPGFHDLSCLPRCAHAQTIRAVNMQVSPLLLEALTQQVASDAADLPALAALAEATLASGRHDEAEDLAMRLLRIDPTHAIAPRVLGKRYLALSRFRKARKYFWQALSHGDDRLHTRLLYAYTCEREGDLDRAASAYGAASRQCPAPPPRVMDPAPRLAQVNARRARRLRARPTDIVLVACPPSTMPIPPIGLGFISEYLRTFGYQAPIIDLNIRMYKKASARERRAWDLCNKNLWLQEASFAELMQRFAVEVDAVIDEILAYEDHLVGFTAIHSRELIIPTLVERIKARDPDRIVVVGGPSLNGLKNRQQMTFNCRYDWAVIGEGEEIAKRLLDALSHGEEPALSRGLVSRERGMTPASGPAPSIVPIDRIPFPRYATLNPGDYAFPGPAASVWSRGCTGRCAFCEGQAIWGRYRGHSPTHVHEDLRFLVRHFGKSHIAVMDPIINGDIEALETIAHLLCDRGPTIRWEGNFMIHPRMSASLYQRLRKSGCHKVYFGLETGSSTVMQKMRKPFNVEMAVENMTRARRAGIQVFINIITGFPGETDAEFTETLDFLRIYHPLLDGIEFVTECQIPEGTALDEHPEDFDLIKEQPFRGYNWHSLDGQNTVQVRKERSMIVEALARELGLFACASTTLLDGTEIGS